MANSDQNIEKKVVIGKDFFADFPIPTYEEWKEAAIKSLKGASFEKKLFTKTHEGITLQPMYRKEDTQDIQHLSSLPGSAPYVRGINTLGYLNRPWEVAQECESVLPDKFNEVVKEDLQKGGQAINILLDEATLLGFEINEVNAEKNEMKGLSLSTLDDLNRAFADIDFESTPIYVNVGESSVGILSLFMALLKAQGKSFESFKGLIGSDPLGKLAKEGKLKSSLDILYDDMAMVTTWAKENNSRLQTIVVEGHAYNNGGANAIQELAFVLASGVSYIKALQERGLDINDIAPRMRFSFSIGSNFFMEIAKLRAARMLWSQIIDAFGGNEEAQKMIINARTSSFTKSVYDPYVNMLRTTTEAFSSVVGGVNSLHVSPFDEPIKEGSTFSRRIARNQQIFLKEECNLKQPVDPAGGSWYIEKLTTTLAEKVWELFQEVESKGGMYQALDKGFVQEEIDKVLQGRFKNLEVRKDVKAGINMYTNITEKREEAPVIDSVNIKNIRLAEIEAYRKDIDEVAKNACLATLKEIGKENVIEKAIEAVNNGATLGEIVKSIHKESTGIQIKAIAAHRLTEKFEELRKATEDYKEKTGESIKVFLTNMGEIPQHKARADFSTGFFEVGALEVLKNDGHASVEEAAQATLASGAPVAVICSTDATYPEIVPPLAKLIKAGNPDIKLFLAGNPNPELKEEYEKAGVDDYVHVRANCYKIIRSIQKERGVI